MLTDQELVAVAKELASYAEAYRHSHGLEFSITVAQIEPDADDGGSEQTISSMDMETHLLVLEAVVAGVKQQRATEHLITPRFTDTSSN